MATREEFDNLIKEALSNRYQGRYEEAVNGFKITLLLLGLLFVEKKEDETWIFTKVGEVMHHIGVTYQNWRKFPEALIQLQETIVIRQLIGDTVGTAYTFFQIPMCRLAQGDKKEDVLPDFQRAEEAIKKAIPELKKSDDIKALGDMNQNLAYIAQQKGEIRQAIDLYSQALVHRERAKDKRGEGLTFARLGECYFEVGDIGTAKSVSDCAMEIFKEIGDVNRIKQVEAILAKIQEKKNK